MKKILLWVGGICLFLLLIVGALLFFKNPILREVTEGRIRSETGLDASIGELKLSLGAGTVSLKNFKILNEPEFGGSALLDVPEIYLAVDSQQAADGKLHFTEVRFHLAEINVVKSKSGELNIDLLQKKQRSKKSSRKKGRDGDFEFAGIDRLYVSLGSIRYTDLGNPNANDVQVLGVTNELIENIKTEEELQAHLMTILVRVALQEWLDKSERPKRRWLRGVLKSLAE